jgi:hypothetical protein
MALRWHAVLRNGAIVYEATDGNHALSRIADATNQENHSKLRIFSKEAQMMVPVTKEKMEEVMGRMVSVAIDRGDHMAVEQSVSGQKKAIGHTSTEGFHSLPLALAFGIQYGLFDEKVEFSFAPGNWLYTLQLELGNTNYKSGLDKMKKMMEEFVGMHKEPTAETDLITMMKLVSYRLILWQIGQKGIPAQEFQLGICRAAELHYIIAVGFGLQIIYNDAKTLNAIMTKSLKNKKDKRYSELADNFLASIDKPKSIRTQADRKVLNMVYSGLAVPEDFYWGQKLVLKFVDGVNAAFKAHTVEYMVTTLLVEMIVSSCKEKEFRDDQIPKWIQLVKHAKLSKGDLTFKTDVAAEAYRAFKNLPLNVLHDPKKIGRTKNLVRWIIVAGKQAKRVILDSAVYEDFVSTTQKSSGAPQPRAPPRDDPESSGPTGERAGKTRRLDT